MEKPAQSSRTELHARRRPFAAARRERTAPAATGEIAPGEPVYFNDIYLLAPVGYFVLGVDTTILQMNMAGADLLGLPRDNPGRTTLRTFVAPRFLDDFERFLRRAVNSGEAERCDLQMARGRGQQGFPVTLRASADSGGQAIRMVLEPAEGRLAALERSDCKFLSKDRAGLWVTLAGDVTAPPDAAELIWRQANFDALTALPNRHMLHDRLEQELKKAHREGGLLALLCIDLDGFRQGDEALGDEPADALLEAARRVGACVRASDTVARLEGDQFMVILSGLDHVGAVDRITQAMLALLSRPFSLGAAEVTLSASIGIALFPTDGAAPQELLRHAGLAMVMAKRDGANRASYFTPDLRSAAQARRQVMLDLRSALSGEQFELHYQPIVDLRSGKIERAEALLRWRHPLRGLLAPAEFLALAESAGLMVEIGDWVFRQAALQARVWQDELGTGFQVGINQSPAQLRGDTELYVGWLNHAAELGLPARSIVIEIAEGVLSDDAGRVAGRLRELREMGLQVALDNFGAGQASLAQLKRFGIDLLKLDRGVVQRLERDSGDLALCEALIVMAHKLGLRVVAEGVETPAQSGLLAMAGCDFAQGYMFARPMPAAEFSALVKRDSGGAGAAPNQPISAG